MRVPWENEKVFTEVGMRKEIQRCIVSDYVYYLEENGEFLPELCFESEEAAIEYAETNAMNNYQVIEWDVDQTLNW